MIYLDSCALVKLVISETETPALKQFLAARTEHRRITATLACTEVIRAIRRATTDQQLHRAAEELVARINHVELKRELLVTAGKTGDPAVRSLDAIHLAAAQALGPALTMFISYDHRLADAAKQAGLPVDAPA